MSLPTSSDMSHVMTSSNVNRKEMSKHNISKPPGILRLNVTKMKPKTKPKHLLLDSNVENFTTTTPIILQKTSSPNTALSQQHLSVTWAKPHTSRNNHNEYAEEIQAGHNSKDILESRHQENKNLHECTLTEGEREQKYYISSPITETRIDIYSLSPNNIDDNICYNEYDEEDYSISVSAIMQYRDSIRSGKSSIRGSRRRRKKTSMDRIFDNMDNRRCSIYTTSSEDATNQDSTQEQIYENIRLHKEVIQSVKLQPWPIRKKLKLVRQAKTYIARHEGALQERFAMSRNTRDLWARFKILMAARWRHWKREIVSVLTVLTPWELRIKEIESHFGSGVASYFTFLRWLMWVNVMIALPLVIFVIGPEYLATKHNEVDPRKKITDVEYEVAGNLLTIWEFEGYLKYSPMFYGYYSDYSGASAWGYKLPLAYFLTSVLVYVYSFVATLRKMAENSRNSKLSSKDDECTFSWKLFVGWDFMIGHAETAHNRIASIVVGFKEALLEEAEKKKDKRNWRIILQRILVNILVVVLLAASGYTVVTLVNKSEEWARHDNWLSRNAVNVTMTLLSFFLPMIFEALGLFENWHPRQQLRLQLARIMILNLLNLYALMFSFIYKINSKEKPLSDLKIRNDSATMELMELNRLLEILPFVTTLNPITENMETIPNDWHSITSSDDANYYDITIGNFQLNMENPTTEVTLTSEIFDNTISKIKYCYNVTVKCSELHHSVATMAAATTTFIIMNLTTTTATATETVATGATNLFNSLPKSMITNLPPTIISSSTSNPLTQKPITDYYYYTSFNESHEYDENSDIFSITSDVTVDDEGNSNKSATFPPGETLTTPTVAVGIRVVPHHDPFNETSYSNEYYDYPYSLVTEQEKEVIQTQSEYDYLTSTFRNRYKIEVEGQEEKAVFHGILLQRLKRFAARDTSRIATTIIPYINKSKYSHRGLNQPSAATPAPTLKTTVDWLNSLIDNNETLWPLNKRIQELADYFTITATTTISPTQTTITNSKSTITDNNKNNSSSNTNNRSSSSNHKNNENYENFETAAFSNSLTMSIDSANAVIATTMNEIILNASDNNGNIYIISTKPSQHQQRQQQHEQQEYQQWEQIGKYLINEKRKVVFMATNTPVYLVNSKNGQLINMSTLSSSSSTSSSLSPSQLPSKLNSKSYNDWHNTDNNSNGIQQMCIRTICEHMPTHYLDVTTTTAAATALLEDNAAITSSTLSSSSTTPTAAKAMSLAQQYYQNLTRLRHTLKEIEGNLTNMCWETSLGQELSKVIVFDGIMGIIAPLCIDFLRALFVRYCNRHCCWDMEKTFPQYGDFKIAENILTLINNQGQVWMGIFFSPGLVLINLIKLVIMMYFRSWIVLTCNVPHEVVFKASKSNNFYMSLLLIMLFLCVLPVGYAIVWLRPSWHCGPFSHYNRISEFITNTTRNALPKELHRPLNYLTSASTIIPLLLLLILIIYYLISLTGALREANQDLRTQLQKEREEERKKLFKISENKQAENTPSTLTNRWRKVLEATSSSPVTPIQKAPDIETGMLTNQVRKEHVRRVMEKTLRKSSGTSEEDYVFRRREDDDTDTEHHDSLPLDENIENKLQNIWKMRKPTFADIVQIATSEKKRESLLSPTNKENVKDCQVSRRITNERKQSSMSRKKNATENTEKKLQVKRSSESQNEKLNIDSSSRNVYNFKEGNKNFHLNDIESDKEYCLDDDYFEGEVSLRTKSGINQKNLYKIATLSNEKDQFSKHTEESTNILHMKELDLNYPYEIIDKKPFMPHQCSIKEKVVFKEYKSKPFSEPDIFKFDMNEIEQKVQQLQLLRPSSNIVLEDMPSSSMHDSTSLANDNEIQPNSRKQGRTKFGTLITLVRSLLINRNKLEKDQPSSTKSKPEIILEMPTTIEQSQKPFSNIVIPENSLTDKTKAKIRTADIRKMPGELQRQDSCASYWSPTIPTITISTISDLNREKKETTSVDKIVKINIDDDDVVDHDES